MNQSRYNKKLKENLINFEALLGILSLPIWLIFIYQYYNSSLFDSYVLLFGFVPTIWEGILISSIFSDQSKLQRKFKTRMRGIGKILGGKQSIFKYENLPIFSYHLVVFSSMLLHILKLSEIYWIGLILIRTLLMVYAILSFIQISEPEYKEELKVKLRKYDRIIFVTIITYPVYGVGTFVIFISLYRGNIDRWLIFNIYPLYIALILIIYGVINSMKKDVIELFNSKQQGLHLSKIYGQTEKETSFSKIVVDLPGTLTEAHSKTKFVNNGLRLLIGIFGFSGWILFQVLLPQVNIYILVFWGIVFLFSVAILLLGEFQTNQVISLLTKYKNEYTSILNNFEKTNQQYLEILNDDN